MSIANRPPLVTYAHFFVSRSRHKSGYARLCIRRDAELQTFPLRESVRKFVHGTNDQRHNSAYSGMCNRLLPICMLARFARSGRFLRLIDEECCLSGNICSDHYFPSRQLSTGPNRAWHDLGSTDLPPIIDLTFTHIFLCYSPFFSD